MSNDSINVDLNIVTSGAKQALEGMKTSAVKTFTDLDKNLKSVENQAKKTQDSLQKSVNINTKKSTAAIDVLKGSFGSLGQVVGGLASVGGPIAAAVVVTTKLVGAFGDAIDQAVKLENSLTGLKSIAKATGNDLSRVSAIAIELSKDGLASVADIATSLKNLLSKGFSLDEAEKLIKITKDTAAFGRSGALSFGDAIRSVTEGIKNENSVLTDNGGITTNLSIMYKEFARSIQTVESKLTDAQKRQAIFNGFQKEGEKSAGDAAKLVDTYSGSLNRLESSYDRLLASLGSFITQSTIVKGVIGFIADGVENLNFANLTSADQLKALTKSLEEFDRKNQQNFNGAAQKKQLEQYIAELTKVVELEKVRSYQGEYEAEQKRKQLEAEKKIDEQRIKFAEEQKKRNDEAAKQLADLTKKYALGGGLDNMSRLRAERDAELEIAKNSFDLKLQILKEYDKKVSDLQEKQKRQQIRNANQLAELNKKIGQDALVNAASSPLSSQQMPEGLTREQKDKFIQNTSIGRGAGILNSVVNGKEGARDLVTGAGALALDSVFPGLGQALKPVIGALTQGPDAVKDMVKQFSDALPDIIQSLIEASPVFITELANQIPTIVDRLAEKAPEIIQSLIKALPKLLVATQSIIPKIAISFVDALVKEAPRFVNGMVASIGQAIKEFLGLGDDGKGVLGSGGGGGIGGALSTGPTKNGLINTGLNVITLGGSGVASESFNRIKKALGFARGGEIPSGYPNDTFPARLSSEELVIDRSTTKDLKNFLKDGGSGGLSEALLVQIRDLLLQPQTIQSSVQVNQREFARIQLQTSRTNQRTN